MKKGVKKKYLDVLEEVMKRAPPELSGKNLLKPHYAWGNTKELLEKALLEDSISDEKKAKFKNILDSGTLDDEKYHTMEVDYDKLKLKNDWVNQELLKYVERGKLPKYVGKNINREIKQRIKNERITTESN
jgi:hypothetical protein